MKFYIGRLRPDFLARCLPDVSRAKPSDIFKYGDLTLYTEVICTGERSIILDGHKSFPSGHASMSWAGLGYVC